MTISRFVCSKSTGRYRCGFGNGWAGFRKDLAIVLSAMVIAMKGLYSNLWPILVIVLTTMIIPMKYLQGRNRGPVQNPVRYVHIDEMLTLESIT